MNRNWNDMSLSQRERELEEQVKREIRQRRELLQERREYEKDLRNEIEKLYAYLEARGLLDEYKDWLKKKN